MRRQVDHLMYAAGDSLRNTIRTGITLTEPIDPQALREAVDTLPKRFPYFAVRLVRDGDDLFYESNEAPYTVTGDGKAVVLGGEESNGHLAAFAYKDSTLFIDGHHFLMDGAGKFPFVKMALYEYLRRVHPEAEFDVSGIPQPGDEISPEEMTDNPYPETPIPACPLVTREPPAKVFRLEDQPRGYESADTWTSFRLKIRQKEMMAFASGTDGSPATFISSLIYRAISDLHPENRLPVVCGMQHQFRKALGNPVSHSSHVRIVPIPYPESFRGRDLEVLNTAGRGVLILQGDDEHDKLIVNEHIRNAEKIRGLSFEEKQAFMRRVVLEGIGKNTFGVSYTGRVPWNGLDRYVTGFAPYIDMTLSGGLTAEIFAIGEYFDINIMQRNGDSRYVDRIISLLASKGIGCAAEKPEHFELCGFEGGF